MVHRSALLSLALLATLACSESPAAPHTDSGGAGQLTMLNALATGDAASVNLDGTTMTLPPAGQSGTATVTAGAHQLQAFSATGQSLASVTFTIADGTHRTTILSGSTGHYVMLLNPIDTAAVPVLDAAKLRIVHTVASAPAMDAYLSQVGHAVDSASRLVTNLQYGSGTDARFPGYAIRPAGQYVITLMATGTSTVLLQSEVLTLNPGDVDSFILAQNAAGELELRTVKEH
jgi:hypothetical protein